MCIVNDNIYLDFSYCILQFMQWINYIGYLALEYGHVNKQGGDVMTCYHKYTHGELETIRDHNSLYCNTVYIEV